ncbi:MAG: YbaY family lipoprotein [Chloroflexota bacterium]|nr:YbaY family lipoprotein [Chloroflexota bacterium]
MYRLFFTTVLLILALGLAGCVMPPPIVGQPVDTRAPEVDASADTPPEGVIETSPANVSSVTIEEEDGEQVAVVQGDHPNSCTKTGDSQQEVVENTIEISLVAGQPADLMCSQMMTPYSDAIVIDTAGLEPGEYTVEVNGVAADETITVGEMEEAARGTDGQASVTGGVNYQVRIALPDDAIVQVQLQDISRADAPAIILGEETFTIPGQMPMPYEVIYDPADVVPNHSYGMAARITSADGKLLMINDTIVPVITRGNPSENVEIMVVPVGG